MGLKACIVGVSDVSIGYGSPQVPVFLNSLVEHYGAEAIVIEPDQPERPPKHDLFPQITVKRMVTSFHPYSIEGRIEYNFQATKEVNQLRPDVLVIYSSYCLPVLLALNFRPKFVVYDVLELASNPFDVKMNRLAAPLVDLLIFPEENRATKYIERCGLRNTPKVILYNCTNLGQLLPQSIVPPEERNGRIIYHGTIDEERTFAKYFAHPKTRSISIDMFGLIDGPKRMATAQLFSKLSGSVRYRGYLDAKNLANVRKQYCFSIVIWNPNTENQLYAAPNKFFEAIADGVPPITAPHPQCKMLVQRYKCGIVMDDWSFAAFYNAIQTSLKIYGTDLYSKMVKNCYKAVAVELNWERQFAKVRPHLKEVKR